MSVCVCVVYRMLKIVDRLSHVAVETQYTIMLSHNMSAYGLQRNV